MNKKLFALGAAVVAGFLTLTAFQAKTLEQQRAEINASVEQRLAELRMMKEQECMTRVYAEAQRQYDEWMVANAANAPRPGGSRGTVTRGAGPRVTPTPQPNRPAGTAEEQKANTRMSGQGAKQEEQKATNRVEGGQQNTKKEEQKANSRIQGGGGGR